MKKTPIQAAAVALKAAMNGSAVTVVATGNADILQAKEVFKEIASLKLTEHTCSSCETKVNASAYTPEPFCPSCGSTEMKATAHSVKASFTNDDQLLGVECSGCGVTNVIDAKAVRACNGIHCASCGVRLVADADEMPDDKVSAETDVSLEPGKLANQNNEGKLNAPTGKEADLEPKVTKLSSDTDDVMEDVDTFSDALTDDVEAAVDDFDFAGDTADIEDEDLTNEFSLEASDDDEEDNGEEENASAEDTFGAEDFGLEADFTDNLDPVTVGDEQRVEPQVTPMITSGEPLVDALDFNDTVDDVSFMELDNTLVAVKANYSIAILDPRAVKANASVVFTQAFPSAVLRAAQQQGLRKALKAFKFKMLLVPTLSQATVKAKVQAATYETKKVSEKQQAAFAESLAIAAVGMSRNMWKGVKNPLQAAVATEMARLGHRAPSRVAAAIFANQGVEFTKALTQQAFKLAAMTDDAREEFATMLDMTEQLPGEVADANDADLDSEVFATDEYADDVDAIESDEPALALTARLSRPQSSHFHPSQEPALLKASNQRIALKASSEVQAILAGTARLSFD